MNDRERLRLDKYERENAFMQENIADFAKDSPGDKAAKAFAHEIGRAKDFAAAQSGNRSEKALHVDDKDDDLNELKNLMKLLDRAADALSDDVPNVGDLFGLPRNRSEASILAAARAQVAAAAPYDADLVEYDLPADFRAQMQTLIDSIEAANTRADVSGTSGAGATDAFKDSLSKLGKISKKLDLINRNKYRSDPAKLGAWLAASHLERAPAKKSAPPTPLQ